MRRGDLPRGWIPTCGEASAQVTSIGEEGLRATVRRDDRPWRYQKPTLVNNVETLANVAGITPGAGAA
jgi:NADH:ubiquinone oxidoreductase subunit F (NADH-binding)